MEETMIEYRKANLNDVEQINYLYQEFFLHNANQQPAYYKAAVESGRYPTFIIESENEELIIATNNGMIIGFIHILEDKTPPFDCYIPQRFVIGVDLYILPEYRKQGIGTKLINKAKSWATERDIDYIELNVLSVNENAIRLYKNAGFEVISHIMRYRI